MVSFSAWRRPGFWNVNFSCWSVLVAFLFSVPVCIAQTAAPTDSPAPPIVKSAAKPDDNKGPLSDKERAELLALIKNLQERVTKLEAAQAASEARAAANASSTGVNQSNPPAVVRPNEPPIAVAKAQTGGNQTATEDKKTQTDDKNFYGKYTENFGYKLADTEYGDLSLSIYTYARYLNQLDLNPTFTDAFGNVKNVQRRQDFQLNKMQIKFLGWILNPKLRYFLYAWTSNANQGVGAQVVLAGNLNYTFNKYLTLSAGINGLPGTRSIEGNFPFWLGVDSRLIADEFMRGSYTSGIWAKGQLTDKLRYQVMLGNNLSTLGVPASRLDNGLNTFASALVWTPSTGEFGVGFGDFEQHKKVATRLAFHYSRSDENDESQPTSDQFENTQLRLSDGTVIFAPNIFGKGVRVTDVRYQMTNFDGGVKYKGFALEGAIYMRWLDKFRGPGTEGLEAITNQGYQIEASAMLIPKTLQLYTGHSRIFGDQGDPWDFRVGVNWFPWKNRVVRWNNELLYLNKSPVGYTSVPFALGGKGLVFHSTWELAF